MSPEDSEEMRAFPWPEAGDRLLQDGPWTLNACMPGKWSDGWHGYIDGYQRAATILFKQVSAQRGDLDRLVFPFVFLWRQHIELQLKQLISIGRDLEGNGTDYPQTHSLQHLWQEARMSILREEPKVLPECCAVDAVVAEFAQIDRGSFDFRYPEDKAGKRTLQAIGNHLNFESFQRAMLKVSAFLGCASTELGMRLDYQRECRWEAQQEERRSRPR